MKKGWLVVTAIIIFGVIGLLVVQKNKYNSVQFENSNNFSGVVNFQKEGNIVNQDGTGWRLVYEAPGAPALTAKLLFVSTSICDLGAGSVSCGSFNLENGTRIYVEGNNAAGVVTVSKLVVRKEQ